MNRIAIVFVITALPVALMAACPAGTADDGIYRVVDDGASCPSGYAAATDIQVVKSGCDSGYAPDPDPLYLPDDSVVYSDAGGSYKFSCTP